MCPFARASSLPELGLVCSTIPMLMTLYKFPFHLFKPTVSHFTINFSLCPDKSVCGRESQETWLHAGSSRVWLNNYQHYHLHSIVFWAHSTNLLAIHCASPSTGIISLVASEGSPGDSLKFIELLAMINWNIVRALFLLHVQIAVSVTRTNTNTDAYFLRVFRWLPRLLFAERLFWQCKFYRFPQYGPAVGKATKISKTVAVHCCLRLGTTNWALTFPSAGITHFACPGLRCLKWAHIRTYSVITCSNRKHSRRKYAAVFWQPQKI